jgi:hypothetical protein
MTEPKPFASLTSGLLARKGGARPAMRRQMALGHDNPVMHDDLGWNDMGYDVDPLPGAVVHHASGLSPMPHGHGAHADAAPAPVLPMPGVDGNAATESAAEPVVVQQRRKAQALANAHAPLAAPTAQRDVKPRAEAGANGRFAFTLRLNAERHLLLRLASAATNRSAQQILVQLVDDYFASQPAVAAMAAQLGHTKSEGKSA